MTDDGRDNIDIIEQNTMPRILKVAAAQVLSLTDFTCGSDPVFSFQVGAIDRGTSREVVLNRLISLLNLAAERSVQLVVFPELAFTTFFPRYFLRDDAELDAFFEHETSVDGENTFPSLADFFAHAKKLGVDIIVGFAEKSVGGNPYNSACYVSGSTGKITSKYRKVHLPGTFEPFDDNPSTTNQLEKRLL